MKLSEIIVSILAKKQKKPASAIYAKYGPALEAADEAYKDQISSIGLTVHAAAESAIGAKCEGKADLAKPTHTEEPTSFSQPTKFFTPQDRTMFVANLQFDLEASRKRMAMLWEERGEVERSFQARIASEAWQIELLEARIHLTHNTPIEGGESIPGPIHCATPFLKGGY